MVVEWSAGWVRMNILRFKSYVHALGFTFQKIYDQVITMYFFGAKKGAHFLNPATTSTFTEQAI